MMGRDRIVSQILYLSLYLLSWIDRNDATLHDLYREKLKGTSGSNAAASLLAQILTNPFSTDGAQVSEGCRIHSQLYTKELKNLSPWALNMYDASAKLASGILTGNIVQLGQTDQCLENVNGPFSTQHCLTSVVFHVWNFTEENDGQKLIVAAAKASGLSNFTGPNTYPYQWAFCIPEACSLEDLKFVLEAALKPLDIPGHFGTTVHISEGDCLKHGDDNWDLGDAMCLILILLILLLVVMSTTIGYYFRRQNDAICVESCKTQEDTELKKWLTSFDLHLHWQGLSQRAGAESAISCIDGLRFLTMCWIIFGHTFYMYSMSPQINLSNVAKLGDNIPNMLILNSTLSTDTFFVVGGALAICSLLKRKNINLVQTYLYRYFRLTPVYALVIFFYATLLRRLGSGLLWSKWINTNSQFCQENWWTNLLYINTFFDVGRMCMSHSWYLSVDMQMFLFVPVIFLVIKNNFRMGLSLILLALLGTIAATWSITSSLNLLGAMVYLGDQEILGNIYVNIYTKFYTRAGPYLIGILLGFLLHNRKENKFTFLKPWYMPFYWIFFIGISLASLFGVWPMYNKYDFENILHGMYASLHRICWSMGVSWIVFTCAIDQAGPIASILNWGVWGPLAKITYSGYLVHLIILLTNSGISRVPAHFDMYRAIREALANLFITMFIGLILYLCVEAPFFHIFKLLVSEKRTKSKSQKTLNGSCISKTTTSDFTSSNLSINTSPVMEGFTNENFQGDVY